MKFVRFCTVGLLNTLVGLTIIFALMRIANLNYVIANVLGYCTGFLISFSLNRSWTFAHNGPILRSAIRWAGISVLAYGLNLAVVIVLHETFGISKYIAQIFGVPLYTAFSFLGGRYYAFKPQIT